MKPDEFDLYTELYGIRLLIFMEQEPQSNNYRQVLLNPEQFKTLSLTLGEVVSQVGSKQEVELNFSDETYTLPDLQEIHEDEEVEEDPV